MKPQLLAPAGSLEKLKWAVHYGADAVYFGMKFGSLRSFAGNLTTDEAAEGIDFLHKHNKKAYVTLNIYPFSEEYDKLIETAKNLDDMKVNGLIISDIGVLTELKKQNIKADIHISTQANTTSYQAVLAYHALGAKRVNLARELSLSQIQEIQQKVSGIIETEVFIHGSVCFSYSGRCAISDYLTGYRANRGECKHPCRWKYFVVEENRPDQYLPVFEDNKGLYIFNSRELALFEFVPQLAQAGVASFKIEGRMKSVHYIASIVSFYRKIIDGQSFTTEQALQLISRVPNRGYSAGFMKGSITPEDYKFEKSVSSANSVFIANVLEEKTDGKTTLEIRNNIYAGETLEVLTPGSTILNITLPPILQIKDSTPADKATNSQFVLLDYDLPPYSVIRRVNG